MSFSSMSWESERETDELSWAEMPANAFDMCQPLVIKPHFEVKAKQEREHEKEIHITKVFDLLLLDHNHFDG